MPYRRFSANMNECFTGFARSTGVFVSATSTVPQDGFANSQEKPVCRFDELLKFATKARIANLVALYTLGDHGFDMTFW